MVCYTDVNAVDHEGKTPLYEAIGSLAGTTSEVINYLLEAGANMELRVHINDKTPLLSALDNGNEEFAVLLIERGIS